MEQGGAGTQEMEKLTNIEQIMMLGMEGVVPSLIVTEIPVTFK